MKNYRKNPLVKSIALICLLSSSQAFSAPTFEGYKQSVEGAIPKSKTMDRPPVDVTQEDASVNQPVQKAMTQTAEKKTVKLISTENIDKAERTILNVENGVLQIVYISQGHLNRIETPFSDPVITTSAPDDVLAVKQDRNVVYFGTQSKDPITVYMSPRDNTSISIPIVLLALNTTPKDILVNVKGYVPQDSKEVLTQKFQENEKQIQRLIEFEKKGSQNYEMMLTEMAITLARGETPNGYSLQNAGITDNYCFQKGMRFTPVQKGAGFMQDVIISKVENISGRNLEFNEKSCYTKGVRLVSAYPNVKLSPGGSAEVYVVVGKEIYNKPTKRTRAYIEE